MRCQSIGFCTILTLLLLLSSCGTNKNLAENEKYELDDPVRGICASDFETSYAICKDFLVDYYRTRSGEMELDNTKYIKNPNLIYYIDKLIEETSFSLAIDNITFGLLEIEWHEEQQYVFFHLASVVEFAQDSSSGETHQFLVKNQNNHLVIVDWYSEGKFDSATFDFFREQHGKISDPTIWDNESWVQDFFRRANIQ